MTPERLAWLFVLLVCGSLFGITGWRLLHAHDLELARSRVTTANLARSLADHAGGTVGDADIVLAGLAERLQADGASGAALARIHQLLIARVAAIPALHHLVVFSAGGDALTASFDPMPPVNVADRAYFAFHRDNPSPEVRVGPAVRNRADGRWSLMVSRRFEGADGRFGGVVVAVIDCDTFLRFYASFDVGPNGAINLLHDDNTIVARHPEPRDPGFRNTPPSRNYRTLGPVGHGQFVSPLDGVERLAGHHRVARAPLIVIVALSRADVLAAWTHDAWVALAACSAVSAALLLLGFGLISQIRRGDRRELTIRRSERRYRFLAEHSTDVIIQLGPDCRRRYVSPASERLLGYRPEEMLRGHPRDTCHPDDWPGLERHIAEMLRAGHAPPITYRMRLGDGRYLWVETLGQMLDGDQTIDGGRGIIVTIRDATHRKEAEGRLREEVTAREEAQARLAHAQRIEALGQLAGGIAHDFNNVLQAVQGGARLIERRPGDAKGVERLARIVAEAAVRGASVTRRLLAFSRRGDLRAEVVEPAALLGGMREILRHTLGAGIEIRVQAPAWLSPLLADRSQLETVLVNLATNARDAMPTGGVLTLTAAVQVLDGEGGASAGDGFVPASLKPGRYLRLSVADDGCGMTPEVLARSVEPFFTTKPLGSGTGLGLSMATGFAEQSGGALTVDSSPGRGTTVALWLPAAASPAMLPADPDEETGPAPGHRGGRILLVDDDAVVREVIAAYLTEAGYDVLPAASGATALTLLDAGEAVDLLVSDLSMPGMDGIAVIREVQRRRRGLPAILLTGFANRAAELAAGRTPGGTFSLLRKPIEARALADRVAVLLEGTMAPADAG